ncbi:MAG TPA: hypothetical protein VGT99_08590 [Gammaproteobacteria bacterium]|nr:hypothetical protein [Gammaproteobacteria bacterium]
MDRRASLKLACVTILLGLGLVALPVQAGTDSWSVAGSPGGGTVSKVVVNPAAPSILYAASGTGVFKSTDSGADWTLVFGTPIAPNDLAIDPLNPSILYTSYSGANTGFSGDATKTLFKSTDGGATWTEMDTGIGAFASSTAIDPVVLIAVDPVNAGTAYAAALSTGIYKTTDGGLHWTSINTGLPTLIFSQPFTQLAVDPANPQLLFLIAQNLGGVGIAALSGLYTSADGGAHWTATSQVGGSAALAFAIDPRNAAHLIACGITSGGSTPALSSSTDSGATWSSTTFCPFAVNALSFDPSNSQHLVAATQAGAYQSADGGATWNLSTEVNASYVLGVSFDPVTPANIYVGTFNWGLFKSADHGSTWAQADKGLHSVAVNQMLMGTDGAMYLASWGSGIYKSTDQGVTWTEVGTAVSPASFNNGIYVYGLAEDPQTPSTLYAGTADGLYKTTDGGAHWSAANSGMPYFNELSIAIDPEATSTVYVGTAYSGGIYKSTNGGSSWTSSSIGLPITAGGFDTVPALAVDPADSNVVYAGMGTSASFKSMDGGASWASAAAGIATADVEAIAVDPANHAVVYASASNGMYKSTDAGASWALSDTGMTGHFLMTNIQIEPQNTSVIYASQAYNNVSLYYGIGGAYVSTNGGANWSALSNGLPVAASGRPVAIISLAVDPVHYTQVFGAGTDGQVYVYTSTNLPAANRSINTGSGGGGRGAFSLVPLGLLLGLAGLRRRRRR